MSKLGYHPSFPGKDFFQLSPHEIEIRKIRLETFMVELVQSKDLDPWTCTPLSSFLELDSRGNESLKFGASSFHSVASSCNSNEQTKSLFSHSLASSQGNRNNIFFPIKFEILINMILFRNCKSFDFTRSE